MDRNWDVVTFDCYGTLVDWNDGIAGAFEDFARAKGIEFEREAVLAAYHATEPAVEGEAFRRYRDVLAETAERAARRLGWPIGDGEGRFLPESFDRWIPFDDTNASIERLAAAGYRLGILSNVDDDLLAITRRKFSVEFDLIVTAEQVEAYKPAQGHFDEARKRIGGARWLHAAQSHFHDIAPAVRLGIDSAWVNRLHDEPSDDTRPLREVATLTELADWLAPRG